MTEADLEAHALAAPGVAPVGPGRGAGVVRVLRKLTEANAAVVTVLAVFSALVFGAILIIVTTPATLSAWGAFTSSPLHALSVSWTTVADAYSALFTGSIVSPSALSHAISSGSGWAGVATPISETLVSATPLILAGLGVAIGFTTGVFNIGAQGQLICGALAATYVGFEVKAPIGLHLPLVIVAGALGGGLAGFVVGYLKARTGAHEVITTIMLNYVFINLLEYFLTNQPFQQPGQSNDISRTIPGSARLPHLLGSGLRLNAGIIVALVAAAFAWWLLSRSTLGFKFRVVGANPDAARTAGIDVRRVMVLALVVSAALAGLAGMAQVSGVDYMLTSGYGGNIGFNAITVALLGRNRPIGVVLGSLLFAALSVGGRSMQAATSIPIDLTSVIQAVIVFFVATPALVREIFRLRDAGGGSIRLFTKGWSG